jgi:hypothetical protein
MYQCAFCYGSDLIDYHVKSYTRLVLAKLTGIMFHSYLIVLFVCFIQQRKTFDTDKKCNGIQELSSFPVLLGPMPLHSLGLAAHLRSSVAYHI